MAISLNARKGLSMAVFTATSIIGAVIAVKMKENAPQLYVTCGVLFSAGILLAGAFVHLLVDSNEQFDDMGGGDWFPWVFAVAGVTIAFLACFEIVLDRLIEDYMSSKRKENEGRTGSLIEHQADPSSNDDRLMEAQVLEASHGTSLNAAMLSVALSVHSIIEGASPDNTLIAVVLTAALSVHSIIEGLGIGASGDITEISSLFITITAHKGFAAFTLAQGLVCSGFWSDRGKRKYFYLCMGIFIFTSLLGIAIGWAINSDGGESTLTAIFISMTLGSFIYVALLELMPHEKEIVKRERLPMLPVVLSFLTGYCIFTLLAIWV